MAVDRRPSKSMCTSHAGSAGTSARLKGPANEVRPVAASQPAPRILRSDFEFIIVFVSQATVSGTSPFHHDIRWKPSRGYTRTPKSLRAYLTRSKLGPKTHTFDS